MCASLVYMRAFLSYDAGDNWWWVIDICHDFVRGASGELVEIYGFINKINK